MKKTLYKPQNDDANANVNLYANEVCVINLICININCA